MEDSYPEAAYRAGLERLAAATTVEKQLGELGALHLVAPTRLRSMLRENHERALESWRATGTDGDAVNLLFALLEVDSVLNS